MSTQVILEHQKRIEERVTTSFSTGINIIKNRNQTPMPTRPTIVDDFNVCPKCVSWSPENQVSCDNGAMQFQGYDDLNKRPGCEKIYFKYQTAQYHPGHYDALELSLKMRPDVPTIFLVNTSLTHDINLMDMVMQERKMIKPYWYMRCHRTNKGVLNALKRRQAIYLPIKILDCCVEAEHFFDKKDEDCWELHEVPKLLKDVMDAFKADPDFDVRIVQAIVNKDHDLISNWSFGAKCVKIMQPFYLRQFNPQTPNKPPPELSVALAHHFGADTCCSAPILPASIMALILCYIDRIGPISFNELDELFEWFCKSAVSNNVHLAFSGTREATRNYSFIILSDYVQIDEANETVTPVKLDLLKHQAEVVVPKIAHLGIIAYGILTAINSRSAIQDSKLKPNMRVSKKKVIIHSKKIMDLLQKRMPFKKPCLDDDDYIYGTFNTMGQSHGYYTVTDPCGTRNRKPGYIGDADSDSDYPMDLDEDPSRDPWIHLTPRQYRVDRLNLCLNAVHEYARESLAKNSPRPGDLPSAPSPTEMNQKYH